MALPPGGVRVLDPSQILAGPYGRQVPAALGAEVMRIEQPGAGDGCRGFPAHFRQGSAGISRLSTATRNEYRKYIIAKIQG
jgi:crotonobetainyl-CoA:carnitine CoA-transferase CaiB-like acyl-CoA transferase